jgi:epoxyqueuosine reductase
MRSASARADEAWAASERLEAFVEAGRHGTMELDGDDAGAAAHADEYVGGRKVRLVVAMNYGPDHDPLEDAESSGTGNISVYARGRDYHDTLKGR